jgi:hypothetical protein
MKTSREKSDGFGINRSSQKQISAGFSTRVGDLESPINRKEKETDRAKEPMSAEIKGADSESETTKVLFKTKEATRSSSRRRKFRIYLP